MRLERRVTAEVRSFSRAELEAATSATTLRSAVRRGLVMRVFDGIFIAGEHADAFAARAHAAVRWAGSAAVLGGEAALFLWGGLESPPDVIQVLVPRGTGRKTPPWIRLTHTSYAFATAEWQGVKIATAPFALMQGYGHMPARDRDNAVYRTVATKVATTAMLIEAAASVPRIRGRRALEATLAAAHRGAESYLERHGATTAFNCSALVGLIQQHRIRVGSDRYRCDFYDPESRTAIELDGSAFHQDPHARERDIRRDARLASVGIQTIRFGYRDMTERPAWCREQVIQAIESRSGPRTGPNTAAVRAA